MAGKSKTRTQDAPEATLRPGAQQIEQIPVSDLIPYARNARTHSEEQVGQIAGSIQEFGFNVPVLIDGQNGIIAGHGRVLAAQRLKLDTVPCIRLTHLTDAQRRAYILADNRIALNSGWDEAMLQVELEELHADDVDLGLLGFEAGELETLLQLDLPEGANEITEDEVPTPPADPITKPGDLWLLGDHRLLCGDSTKAEDVERLMAGNKINLAFTSPPYASQRKYDESSGFKPIPESDFCGWFRDVQENVRSNITDDGSWFVNIKAHCEDGCRALYVFDLVLAHVREWGWRFVDDFVWRRSGLPGSWDNRFKNQHEPIFHFSVTRRIKFNPDAVRNESDDAFSYTGKLKAASTTNPISFSGSDVHRQTATALPGNVLPPFRSEAVKHEAAFPVGLPSFFVRAYSDPGDNVYEPFCGSGTTLIAAEQLGRKCYGMEISPAYCDVIVKRWETLTGKKASLEVS